MQFGGEGFGKEQERVLFEEEGVGKEQERVQFGGEGVGKEKARASQNVERAQVVDPPEFVPLRQSRAARHQALQAADPHR